MPCYDGHREEREREEQQKAARLKETAQKLSAVLCGTVKAFGIDTFVSAIDWEKTGVTEEFFRNWWKEHQEADAKKESNEGAA